MYKSYEKNFIVNCVSLSIVVINGINVFVILFLYIIDVK